MIHWWCKMQQIMLTGSSCELIVDGLSIWCRPSRTMFTPLWKKKSGIKSCNKRDKSLWRKVMASKRRRVGDWIEKVQEINKILREKIQVLHWYYLITFYLKKTTLFVTMRCLNYIFFPKKTVQSGLTMEHYPPLDMAALFQTSVLLTRDISRCHRSK